MIVTHSINPGMFMPGNPLFVKLTKGYIKTSIISVRITLESYVVGYKTNPDSYHNPVIKYIEIKTVIEKLSKDFTGSTDIIGKNLFIYQENKVDYNSNSLSLNNRFQLRGDIDLSNEFYKDRYYSVYKNMNSDYVPINIGHAPFNLVLGHNIDKSKFNELSLKEYIILYYYHIENNKVVIKYPATDIILSDMSLNNVISVDWNPEVDFKNYSDAIEKLEDMNF